jgi:hypothetical protein
MIKTLRITSFIVAIAAVVLLILPVVYGVRNDPKIEEFLKKPGVVEKLTAAGGQNTAKNDSQNSPLVKNAIGFSTIINPPPPPPPKVQPGASQQASAQPPTPPAPVAVKFDLVATSYSASDPKKSFVLIDEAGKGLHWVKQGSTLGHVTIETIKDGAIVVRDGSRTSEMTVKVKENWRGLLKNPPPTTKPGEVSISPAKPAAMPSTVRQELESPVQPSPVTTNKPGISTPTQRVTPPIPNRRNSRVGMPPPASERITSGAQPTPAVLPPPPAAEITPPPEEKPAPVVEVSPRETELRVKIDKLTAEIESAKNDEETRAKMNEMAKLLEQLESTNSPDVNK